MMIQLQNLFCYSVKVGKSLVKGNSNPVIKWQTRFQIHHLEPLHHLYQIKLLEHTLLRNGMCLRAMLDEKEAWIVVLLNALERQKDFQLYDLCKRIWQCLQLRIFYHTATGIRRWCSVNIWITWAYAVGALWIACASNPYETIHIHFLIHNSNLINPYTIFSNIHFHYAYLTFIFILFFIFL